MILAVGGFPAMVDVAFAPRFFPGTLDGGSVCVNVRGLASEKGGHVPSSEESSESEPPKISRTRSSFYRWEPENAASKGWKK